MARRGLLLTTLLAGCVPLHSPTMSREVSLAVCAHINKQVQTIINPLGLSDIATLDVVPYIETTPGSYSPISYLTGNPTTVGAADMLKLSQASPTIDPTRPFLLHRLKPQKNYRIYGRAYNAGNALISQDSASYVDVSVGNNDAPAIAQLPVLLGTVPFAATASVTVSTDGICDYLKGTLYLTASNTQVGVLQTTRANPTFTFSNLQGATNYRLVLDAYKLGTKVTTQNFDFGITNDTAPVAFTTSMTIPYIVTTMAGSSATGSVDAVGTAASFVAPSGVAVDAYGNVFVADYQDNRIRKITPTGVVSTFAGNGVATFADGTGTAASFNLPHALAFDSQGILYVADHYNHRIRKITPNGVVSTLAGNGQASPPTNGTGTSAILCGPYGLTVDSAGNVYVADHWSCLIRKIDPSGVVTTFAGSGIESFGDGVGTAASFNNPVGMAVDSQGNVFVGDRDNCRIRKITPAGVVTTFAGSGANAAVDGTGTAAALSAMYGITMDAQNNIYVADSGNQLIRKITAAGVVTTLAGNGVASFADGTGSAAKFAAPRDIKVDSQGNLYVADFTNHRIRKLQ